MSSFYFVKCTLFILYAESQPLVGSEMLDFSEVHFWIKSKMEPFNTDKVHNISSSLLDAFWNLAS